MVINPLVSQSPWGTGQQALLNTISRKNYDENNNKQEHM